MVSYSEVLIDKYLREHPPKPGSARQFHKEFGFWPNSEQIEEYKKLVKSKQEKQMENDLRVPSNSFDYEKSLWDNVVLNLVNQGEPSIAAAEANAIIEARRQMFNDKQQGEA